jgi:hypothetical protein
MAISGQLGWMDDSKQIYYTTIKYMLKSGKGTHAS